MNTETREASGRRRGVRLAGVRRRLLAAAAVFALCALPWAQAMDWPTTDGREIKNFGMNEAGMPLLGDVFIAESDVYSADPGETLFWSESGGAENFISPLGNWAAIDHGDNYVSVYARLAELPAAGLPARIEKGATLAKAGRSGWTARSGFYFSFYDRRERQWVNPVVILNPLPDTIAPQIHSVRLKNSAGQVFDLAQTRTIKQGRYRVIVYASDRSETSSAAVAPFRIVCSLNGVEIGRFDLDALSARDGSLLIHRNGLVPASEIYAPQPAVEAGGDVSFARGQAGLDISVQDFARNTRNASFRIFVE